MKHTILTVLVIFLRFFSFASIGSISGPTNACIGSTIMLADTTSGGTWSSSNLGIASVDSATGIVTGISSGSVIITYTTISGFVTKSIYFNALPSIYSVIGGGSFCPGGIGVRVGLSGSQPGASYQLMNGTMPTGPAMPGTGSPIDFGLATSPGTYTVVAATSMGCANIMSGAAVVTIGPAPIISGPLSICVGTPISLSAFPVGGAWASSNPAVIGVDPTTGLITGMSSGVSTISYTTMTGCYTSRTMTVNISPSAISGVPAVCIGAVDTLRNSVPGGLWSSSAPSVANASSVSGIVIGISAGTATISYSIGDGCSVIKLITVNPAPSVILGTSSVCSGGTILLTDSVSGGAWSSSSPSVALPNSTTGAVTGYATGTASITYAIGGICFASHSVTVTPGVCSGLPTGGSTVASNTNICPGLSETISLSGASSGCGIVYQWQVSTDGITFTDITGATFPMYNYTASISQYYRCKVICSTTGLFTYSTAITINVTSNITSYSIVSPSDTSCSGPDFYISACGSSTSFNVTTWFGDGTSVNTPLTSTGVCHADVTHAYILSGTYSIKQVLYIGTVLQDSVTFSYEYQYCRMLPVKFFLDLNSNCIFDSTDKIVTLPVLTEVDSNGTAIDSISSTSGFYYKANGPAGTIYAFRVISAPGDLHPTCPITGILYDTIQPTKNIYQPKYCALNCSGGMIFDLQENVSANTGRHQQVGTIIVNNAYCIPQNALITLHFSPKYIYSGATPTPTMISGNTLTWFVPGITSTVYPIIEYTLTVPLPGITTTWLTPGDTVMSNYVTIATLSGDTSNNTIKIDTVKSSYDPNEISVFPSGYVLPCTKLEYTIRFENTGNDTAHNISILDTLPDNLDAHSLNVEIASSKMNIAILNNGIHNIVKFDFPNISLLDSTHHNQCDGMVVFNIKVKSGIADGITIFNHAGIFFDDNPAVLTDTVENVIGISPIIGLDTVCITSHITLSDNSTGGIWSISNTNISISSGIVTGIALGLDTVTYTISNTCASKAATKVVTINSILPIGSISGVNTVCEGLSVALSDTLTGGSWTSSDPTHAIVDSIGLTTGVSAGTSTISYSRINGCGSATAIKTITINPMPSAVVGSSAICMGASSILSDTIAGGIWSSGNPTVATIGSATGAIACVLTGSSTITYALPTGCFVTKSITVNSLPAMYHISGGGSYCAGGTGVHLGLTGSSVGTSYMLYRGTTATGTFSGTGGMIDFGLQTLLGVYTATATNTATGCHVYMEDSAVVAITPTVAPAVNLTASPDDTACAGTPITYISTVTNGGSTPVLLWKVDGIGVAYGSSYSFLPANGDVVKVILTSNALCASPDTASDELIMTIVPPLSPMISLSANPGTTIAPGESITLTANVTGYGTAPEYQWVVNATFIAGATNNAFTNSSFQNGDSVTCIVTTSNICGNSVQAQGTIITVNDASVKSTNLENKFLIAPNPAKGKITIEYDLANKDNLILQITDIAGRIVTEKPLSNLSQREEIDISRLSPGLHLYRLIQNGYQVCTGKLIKE